MNYKTYVPYKIVMFFFLSKMVLKLTFSLKINCVSQSYLIVDLYWSNLFFTKLYSNE